MFISTKRPDFSFGDLQRLTRFYDELLRQGFSRQPLACESFVLWLDGKACTIVEGTRWHRSSDKIHIPVAEDREEGPYLGWKLTVILALMSISGHTSNPELMALVEQKLTAFLTGTYQAVMAPLASREDGRPVERIAWSIKDGIAAELDGQWVRPLSGEPVEVTPDWVVMELDTASSRAADTGAED